MDALYHDKKYYYDKKFYYEKHGFKKDIIKHIFLKILTLISWTTTLMAIAFSILQKFSGISINNDAIIFVIAIIVILALPYFGCMYDSMRGYD